MVEVEVEVVGHKVLGVGSLVGDGILRRWDGGCVWGVRVTLSPLVVGSEVRRMLWWRLVTLIGIDMFNGRWAIVTFNRCVSLHTTGLTNGIDLNCRPRRPNWRRGRGHLLQPLSQCVHPTG